LLLLLLLLLLFIVITICKIITIYYIYWLLLLLSYYMIYNMIYIYIQQSSTIMNNVWIHKFYMDIFSMFPRFPLQCNLHRAAGLTIGRRAIEISLGKDWLRSSGHLNSWHFMGIHGTLMGFCRIYGVFLGQF
jgi:hypothetical protein